MKPGPHELAQQHPTKQDVNNDLVMHQKMPCPREVGDRTHKTIGADFRYAVEFSKNGRTPAPVSQPAWGQPCKHYPVRFAVSNCPARSALFTATGAQLTSSLRMWSAGGVAPRPFEGP